MSRYLVDATMDFTMEVEAEDAEDAFDKAEAILDAEPFLRDPDSALKLEGGAAFTLLGAVKKD